MSDENIVIGIDFGTTNSAACIYRNGKTEIIPSVLGNNYFPSVVAVNENGVLLKGENAKKQMMRNASSAVAEFKLEMGKDITINFNGEERRPQEITALVLALIKRDAEAYLGQSVNKAVIGVPNSFNDDAKKAYIEAGQMAKLEVESLVKEPTAACLAYSAANNNKILGNILVFDIGGGTLDIVIGSFDGYKFEELGTAEARVGGRNITIALRDYIKKEFEDQTGLKLGDYITEKRNPCVRLREAAEKAKIELSSTKSANIYLEAIVTDEKKNIYDLDIEVNRSKLNELSYQVVKRSKEKVIEALSNAKLTKEDIDYLVLVGGPTKMPLIKENIEKLLGKSAVRGIDPMLCVSEGASMYLGGPISVNKINTLTLSLVDKDKYSKPLIPKNAPLPAEATIKTSTTLDNQTIANIEIVEGESIFAKDNHSLKRFSLPNLPKRPKGQVKILVTLKVDEDGIMELSAEELSTKNKHLEIFDDSERMSIDEIKYAGFKNDDLLRNYEKKIKEIDIINDAQEVIFKARNLIEELNDTMLITDKEMVNEKIKTLEGLLKNPNDFALIKLNTKNLENLVDKIESDENKFIKNF